VRDFLLSEEQKERLKINELDEILINSDYIEEAKQKASGAES
jgi:hypothetical protein